MKARSARWFLGYPAITVLIFALWISHKGGPQSSSLVMAQNPQPIEVLVTKSPEEAKLESGTGPTLYTSGDLFLANPVEGCGVFVTVILIAAGIELGIDKLRAVDSKYFQMLLDSIQEETLIVGIMTLFLIFVITLGELRLKWVILLNYAVMSLLFMVTFFVIIICTSVVLLRWQLLKWRDFEGARMDADPLLSEKEQLFKLCRNRFRESLQEKKVKSYPEMYFTAYLDRMTKYSVAGVADLSWKSWAALSMIIVVNGVRSRITIGDANSFEELSSVERTVNIGSYIIFCGYIPLAGFFVFNNLLEKRLQKFAELDSVVQFTDRGSTREVYKPSEGLFFGSLDITAQIFQTIVLMLEWYFAIFILGMVTESWKEFGPAALIFYIVAAVPVVVFTVKFPWTLTAMTVLNSLGDDLNIEEATELSNDVRMELINQGMQLGGEGEGAVETAGVNTKKGATAEDEWDTIDPVSFHDTAEDAKLLDNTDPTSTIGQAGTNLDESHMKKDDEPTTADGRPIFRPLLPHELMLPEDTTVVTYGVGGHKTILRHQLENERQAKLGVAKGQPVANTSLGGRAPPMGAPMVYQPPPFFSKPVDNSDDPLVMAARVLGKPTPGNSPPLSRNMSFASSPRGGPVTLNSGAMSPRSPPQGTEPGSPVFGITATEAGMPKNIQSNTKAQRRLLQKQESFLGTPPNMTKFENLDQDDD